MVAKGEWEPNTGYLYTCAKCGGWGKIAGEPCPDCYALDWVQIMEAFKLARGERYYALLKAALSVRGKLIYARFKTMVTERGKFTPVDAFRLMAEIGWPDIRAKAFFEWLEETRCIPTGTYDDLRARGMTIKHIVELAQEK